MDLSYLKKAKMCLGTTKTYLLDQDDCAPGMAGANVEEAAEFAIKCLLDNCGVNYTKTHKIMPLLSLVPDEQTFVPKDLLLQLDFMASAFNEWYIEGWYNKDYLVARRIVLAAINVVEEFIATLDAALTGA